MAYLSQEEFDKQLKNDKKRVEKLRNSADEIKEKQRVAYAEKAAERKRKEAAEEKTNQALLSMPEMRNFSQNPLEPEEYVEGQPVRNFTRRLSNRTVGALMGLEGNLKSLAGTIVQGNENAKRAKEYVEKQKKYGQKMNDIAHQYFFDPTKYEIDPEYQENKRAYDSFQRTINALRNKPLSSDSSYLDTKKRADEFKTVATEGLSPKKKFVADTLGGVLDFAVTLPTAVVGGPQTPLLLSATSSAGQAAADAAEQGMSADKALVRSALSGVATYALSKAPTERLFKLGSQPLPAGKLPAFQTVLSNSAKQGLSEGIEESGEYLFNVAADKAAGVDTPFSVQELAANAGAGALGGFVMGAGASGVGALRGRASKEASAATVPGTLPEVEQVNTTLGNDLYAEDGDFASTTKDMEQLLRYEKQTDFSPTKQRKMTVEDYVEQYLDSQPETEQLFSDEMMQSMNDAEKRNYIRDIIPEVPQSWLTDHVSRYAGMSERERILDVATSIYNTDFNMNKDARRNARNFSRIAKDYGDLLRFRYNDSGKSISEVYNEYAELLPEYFPQDAKSDSEKLLIMGNFVKNNYVPDAATSMVSTQEDIPAVLEDDWNRAGATAEEAISGYVKSIVSNQVFSPNLSAAEYNTIIRTAEKKLGINLSQEERSVVSWYLRATRDLYEKGSVEDARYSMDAISDFFMEKWAQKNTRTNSRNKNRIRQRNNTAPGELPLFSSNSTKNMADREMVGIMPGEIPKVLPGTMPEFDVNKGYHSDKTNDMQTSSDNMPMKTKSAVVSRKGLADVNYSKVVDDMKQRMGYQISNKEKGIVQSELKEIKSLLDNGDEAAAQKKTRELFQHITENTKVDSDLYSSDKDILDKLRTTKVYVSKETRGSIPDYADYAKKNFSRLSLTSDPSAIPVDVFYSELQEQYPHLFDSSVVNPAGQLVRMGEVASSRSPKKISLSEYIGNNKEKRAEYQKEFFKSIYPIVAGKEYSEPGKLPGVDSGRYSDVGSFGENTVGSAEYDPNSLQALADKYGYVPTGGGPKSGIAIVPKAIDDSGKKTRTFARTAIEAIGTSPETVKQIENDILSGKYGYTPGTNQELVKKVGNKISNNGFDRSYQMWQGVVHGNSRIKRDDIMLGTYLAMIADKNGNTKLASEIYADMAAIGTEQGQTVQAFSILKKMGAPAQMRYIDTIVERLNNQKRQQNSPIVIDEELRTELLNAKGQEEIDAVVDKMKDNIASQINTSWMDKLTAWRYMSMLGNPRTHIRNILGNAAFRVAVGIKNIIGTGLEAGVSKIPGVEFERTKSLLTPNDKPLVDYAKRVFDEETTGGSKYNDKNDIENRKNVFKTKALEKARRGIFNSLETEDKIFRKNAFSRSMAGYLKANGVTPENINSFENIGLVNRAKAYAEQEALKTTFQDASMVADVLNSIKKVHPGLDFFVSGVQPFLRTPINIAKRGIEYSPVGLLNGGKDLAKALKKGYSPAEALDEMAAGLTGTGIMALGAWLSDIGVLNAGREDQEKLAAMDDATGVQEYSLVIPGVGSYTIDWLAPAVMPLFVGAELYQTMTDEGATMEDVLGTITRITEPMLQMSMMSSLDSALRSAVYSSDNVGAGVLQVAAKNYLGQYIPTVAGQVARTIDDTRRTSYVEPGAQFPNVESFLQQQQAKIPGLSQNLPPRLNVWGEEDVDDNFGSRLFQNMVSPGYWENDTSTDVERTLESIYRETGDTGVLPRYAAKDFALPDGRTKELSSEEYTKLSKEFGQNSNQILSELFENQDFFSLDAEMQAAMIEDVYKYSLDLAKDDVSGNSFLQDGDATLELFDSGFPVSTYFLTKAQLDSFTGEGSTQQKRDALFAMDDMSGEEKNEFAKLYFDSEKEIDYSNADTYAMTQLSDAGQNKYNRVESLGYSVQKYAELYPIAAASEKKAIVISNLMAAGLTEAQAMEFYRRIKKQDWDE